MSKFLKLSFRNILEKRDTRIFDSLTLICALSTENINNIFNDLKKIIELDPKYKDKIKTAFKIFAEDEEFKKIIE